MSDEKKVLMKQFQLSGIGVIVFVFGLLDHQTPYIIIGICIALFGVLRVLLINKLMNQGKDK